MQSSYDDLAAKAFKLFPQSEYLREQWIKQTRELLLNENHLLFTGRFKYGKGRFLKAAQ